MKFAEFHAWFSGFCEHIEGTPTVKQMERIADRFGEMMKAHSAGAVAKPTPPATVTVEVPFQSQNSADPDAFLAAEKRNQSSNDPDAYHGLTSGQQRGYGLG